MKGFYQSVDSTEYESVAEFYAGKSVFLTGGTGFLGKVLLEKLLHSCKDIGNIFVLIRDRNGAGADERIQELISKSLFGRIKNERPEDLKKIIPVIGDINQVGLGLSSADKKKVTEKVSVVLHVAALIKFNESLDIAVNANVKGTKYVLDLCHKMDNIKAFVHVSTAYCNTDQEILLEKVYPPRANLSDVLKYIEHPHLDEELIKQHFLKGLPNTYTFTKGLAENLIAEHRGNIPTAIVRPSIVSPSLKDPSPGWIGQWFGSVGLTTETARGNNRIIFGDGNNILDIIPVDYVSNVIIVAAAKCSRVNALAVYNCCTSSCNPISIKEFFNTFKKHAIDVGLSKCVNEFAYRYDEDKNMSLHNVVTDNISHTNLMFTNNLWLFRVITFLFQIMPAYIADVFLIAMGKTPRYVKYQSRIIFGRDLLNYFTSHSWEMRADNVMCLHASLSYADRTEFPCNPSYINWDEYLNIFVNGVQSYLTK